MHPLLAAAYPAVFLFAINAAEQTTLDPLWRPLLLSVLGAATVLAVLWVVLGDAHRAGLLTTVAVIGFFGYGHFWNAFGGLVGSQPPVAIAWGVLVLIGLALAWRSGRVAVPATRALNVVAVIAVVMNLTGIAGVVTAYGADDAPAEELSALELAPPDANDLPDVYYIVLDRYAGSTALSETYGFDNEPFLTALEERGFRVARQAHANYIKTPLSLASVLNLDFVDAEALEAEATDGKDRGPIHRVLGERLAVPAALKELGYRYVHLGNWWTPTADNVDADRVFVYDGQDEFTSVFLQSTLLRALSTDAAPTDPWDWPALREHTRYQLRTLDSITGMPGPKYVFAHLLVPHPPYVIDADGSAMDREQVADQGDAVSYLRYLRYGNERMLATVDRILAESGDDAVIVIQADEGPFPARYEDGEWGFQWRDATDEELEEKFGILFAMRVPGADLDAAGFTDDITSVNTFRVVFNARFGTDLPMLPNRTWAHENLSNFYDFFEITDRLVR